MTGIDGVLGELLDLRLVERADHQGRQEAREDERRVAVRLAACQLQLGRRQEERHAAQLRDPDLERDPRPRRRLVEDQPDRPAGQDAELRDAARARPSARRRGRAASASSSRDQSATRVKLRPFEIAGYACHRRRCYGRDHARVARMPTFADALNGQIGYEFAASQQYIAIAGLLRRREPAAARRALLPPGGRGAEPRDDDGAVPPRRRPDVVDARRRRAADRLLGRRSLRSRSRSPRRSAVTEQIVELVEARARGGRARRRAVPRTGSSRSSARRSRR